MKKSVFILLLLTSLSLSFYFIGNTALKEYFNQKYYHAPNLIGLNIDEAIKLTENSPIKVLKVSEEFSQEKPGNIFIQEPKVGSVIKRGRIIRVWVSKGTDNLSVPNVVGLNIFDAKSILESKGFDIGTTATISMNVPSGVVIATDPEPDNIIDKNHPVNILVNKVSETSNTKMPDIVGLTLDDAKALLKNNSLLLGKVTFVSYVGLESGVIVESSIEFNSTVPTGTMIDIKVSK